eukprot:GSChrysophyteH1.ASY1.ANO1.490.1 assembled CDS
MATEGFILRLNKSLWDKASSVDASADGDASISDGSLRLPKDDGSGEGNSSTNPLQCAESVTRKRRRSSYSSDECLHCGGIALAGKDTCISCITADITSVSRFRGKLENDKESDGSSTSEIKEGGEGHSPVALASDAETRKTSSGFMRPPKLMLPPLPKAMPRFSLSSGGKTPTIITTRKLRPSECSTLIEREIIYLKGIQDKIAAYDVGQLIPTMAGQEQLASLGVMTYSQIAQHLISLRVEPMQKLFRPILSKFMQHPRNLQGIFNRPVDTTAEGLTTYLEKIPIPMDLGTIRSKLQRGLFESLHISMHEMRLVFKNAMEFNPEGHTIHTLAKSLSSELETDLTILEEKCVKETERKISHPSSCRVCGGEQCNLCGEKCIRFECPVLLCHGPCMGRVKRNSVYYVSRDGMMLWCQRCFSSLPQVIAESQPSADPPKAPITKRSLLRCKSDEEVSEPWVECDTCHKWVHQICGLYNDHVDEKPGKTPLYECPRCILEAKAMEAESLHQWKAFNLPRTRLSDFVEAMVKEQLRATGYSHVIPSVTIRMASNVDQYVEIPEALRENLMSKDEKKLPKYLEYKQKCLLLFQNIEGVDVCLFSLYVQEFGQNCPEPNKSCVYISYLDSVDYFRPVEVRTMVYHEIMIAYLKWAQLRGFKQGHIWSCPPQRGDNFIFWCHPTHQRTPSRDRLNNWYSTMLSRATHLGLVDEVQNLYETYFRHANKKAAVCPPIFEGDFWKQVASPSVSCSGEDVSVLRAVSIDDNASTHSDRTGPSESVRSGGSIQDDNPSELGDDIIYAVKTPWIPVYLVSPLQATMKGTKRGICLVDHSIQPFEKPVLGVKESLNVMVELARSVDRLKADLFVIIFADPDAPNKEEFSNSPNTEHLKLHHAQLAALPPKPEKSGSSCGTVKRKGGVASGGVTTKTLRPINSSADTSDPDSNIDAPFVDSRHTFLEMCQFRHYEFSSLRRAKHSSMMLLYHLHNPYRSNTRPACVVCRGVIRDIRWHCGDGCPDSDTCQDCYSTTEHCEPEHKLTPYRVTFI